MTVFVLCFDDERHFQPVCLVLLPAHSVLDVRCCFNSINNPFFSNRHCIYYFEELHVRVSCQLHIFFFVFHFRHLLGDNEHNDGSGEDCRETSNGAQKTAGEMNN